MEPFPLLPDSTQAAPSAMPEPEPVQQPEEAQEPVSPPPPPPQPRRAHAPLQAHRGGPMTPVYLPVAPHPLADPHVRRGAAASIIGSAFGLAVGGLLLGPAGAFAGISAVGTARNAHRAFKLWTSNDIAERLEAGRSGATALIGFVLTAYLIHRVWSRSQPGPEPPR